MSELNVNLWMTICPELMNQNLTNGMMNFVCECDMCHKQRELDFDLQFDDFCFEQ